MRILGVVILLLFINSFVFAQNTSIQKTNSSKVKPVSFSGLVLDKNSGEILSASSIVIKELNLWQTTNVKGEFEINNIKPNIYTLYVSCLGYNTVKTKINLEHNKLGYIIKLELLSLSLDEVVVTARERLNLSSTSTINEMAMEHLQPSGVADFFELLPGGKPTNIDYSEMAQVSLRQVGSDNNTSLGTLFIVDDAPLTNDMNMQTPNGGARDIKGIDRYTQSKGVDMRQISADEIEKIDIIRGVPSVEYGDLTSGVVKITRKSGRTPTTIRIKSNINHKLMHIGKGWNLKNNSSLNVGADYLIYKGDPRNSLNSYQRATFSIRYRKSGVLFDGSYTFKSFLDYTGTLDKEKDDEEQLTLPEDKYSSSYNKMLSKIGFEWMSEDNTLSIKTNLSGSYSIDKLVRTRGVSLKGPTPSFTSIEEGRYKSEYLPARYYAEHTVEGKPVNLFLSIVLNKHYNLIGTPQNFKAGLNYSYGNNFGGGQMFDIYAPLFYESGSRPYSFKDIPSIKKMSYFVESGNLLKLNNHIFKIQVGARIGKIQDLDDKYTMANKWYVDPRVNISWKLPTSTNSFDISFYTGYGWQTKFPTSSHLYPHKKYYDVKELDYFSQNPDLRALYINTKIVNPTNYNISPSRNRKIEGGIKLSYKKFTLNLTVFNEYMDNGFTSSTNYFRIKYREYDYSSIDPHRITEPPNIDDLDYSNESRYFTYSTSYNLSSVDKKGIEYVLNFPKLVGLASNLSISGAWFKTNYDKEGERLYQPSIILEGEEYPYIGVYDYDTGDTKEQLNTTIRIDTHLKKIKLIFSNQIYVKWFYKRQSNYNDGIPVAYINKSGERNPFGDAELNDPKFSWLVNTYGHLYFEPYNTPVLVSLNQKVTKEINNNIRISFYINNLIAYQPEYKTPSGAIIKLYSSPYFGAELNIKL